MSNYCPGGFMRAPQSKHLPAPARASADELIRALGSSRAPGERYRCLNPECVNLCQWPSKDQRGRPSNYCSRACRELTNRTRQRLFWECEVLEDALAQKGLSWDQERVLQRALGHRRWALERYPRFEETSSSSTA